MSDVCVYMYVFTGLLQTVNLFEKYVDLIDSPLLWIKTTYIRTFKCGKITEKNVIKHLKVYNETTSLPNNPRHRLQNIKNVRGSP